MSLRECLPQSEEEREVRQEVGFDHREGQTSILKKVRSMTDNYVSDS